MDISKWSPPVWDPSQEFSPKQANGNLEFEISKGWADWAVNQAYQVQEFHALTTLDNPNGGALGFTLRVLGGESYAFMLKERAVAVWGPDGNETLKSISGTTHLQGAKRMGVI